MLESSCRTGDDDHLCLPGASILLCKNLLNSLFLITSSLLLVTIYYPTFFTHPLLSIAVLQVIEVSILPADADAQQISRFKTILSQDHKVGEDSCQSLDHPCE